MTNKKTPVFTRPERVKTNSTLRATTYTSVVTPVRGLRRSEDMLVCVALARFGKRQALSQLPDGLRADIRAFFGTPEKGSRHDQVIVFRACDFFFQAEDGIRDDLVTGVQTCALPI